MYRKLFLPWIFRTISWLWLIRSLFSPLLLMHRRCLIYISFAFDCVITAITLFKIVFIFMIEDRLQLFMQLALFSFVVSWPSCPFSSLEAPSCNVAVSQLTSPLKPWEGKKNWCASRVGSQPKLQMTWLIWELKTIFSSTALGFLFFLLLLFPQGSDDFF